MIRYSRRRRKVRVVALGALATFLLVSVALGILVIHWLDVFWWIEPAYPHTGQRLWWLLDVSAAAAVGGLTLALFVRQLRRGPVLPVGVPHLEEAFRHD